MNFIIALIGIAASYLEKSKNKTAQEIGTDIQVADELTLAVLQENAKIKGVTLDWNDPSAVQGFIMTLPTFTPIPEPGQDSQTKTAK